MLAPSWKLHKSSFQKNWKRADVEIGIKSLSWNSVSRSRHLSYEEQIAVKNCKWISSHEFPARGWRLWRQQRHRSKNSRDLARSITGIKYPVRGNCHFAKHAWTPDHRQFRKWHQGEQWSNITPSVEKERSRNKNFWKMNDRIRIHTGNLPADLDITPRTRLTLLPTNSGSEEDYGVQPFPPSGILYY